MVRAAAIVSLTLSCALAQAHEYVQEHDHIDGVSSPVLRIYDVVQFGVPQDAKYIFCTEPQCPERTAKTLALRKPRTTASRAQTIIDATAPVTATAVAPVVAIAQPKPAPSPARLQPPKAAGKKVSLRKNAPRAERLSASSANQPDCKATHEK